MADRETSDNVGQVRADLSKRCWNCNDPIPDTRELCISCERRMRIEDQERDYGEERTNGDESDV